MTPTDPPGRLEVICGCMFSGKTTELIRRLDAARASGRAALAITPAADTRAAPGRITTHDGRWAAAVPAHSADQIPTLCADARFVGIDEAHFFGASLIGPCLSLIDRGRTVIIAGVDRDHRGRPFEPFPTLLCEADEVVKTTCPCALCGRPAVHSQRLFAAPDRIAVGGAGDYQPRCRRCFQPPADTM